MEKNKSSKVTKIVVAATIVVILAVFAGIIYYQKAIKPSNEFDEAVGYKVDDYVKLGKYKGLKYDIDQKKFDKAVRFHTVYTQGVDRAAKQGDALEFSYTGFIDGKKCQDLSKESVEVQTDEENNSAYTKFTNALMGKKKGDVVKVTLSGKEASELSLFEKKYDKPVNFVLKLIEVNKVEYSKVTDKWIKNEMFEDAENVQDFYKGIEDELQDDAVEAIWEQAIKNAKVIKYPKRLLKSAQQEFDLNAKYERSLLPKKDQKKNLKEYYKSLGYTKESLQKEYNYLAKQILVAWAIAKKEDIKITDDEVESRYQSLLDDYKKDGDKTYNTVDELKKDYDVKEIKDALYNEKSNQFVCDNANVTKSYTVPK